MEQHILVVDDDYFCREMVNLTLSEAGFQVTTARDGKEALATLDQIPVNLIISDVEMPQMDGHEFAREVGEHPRFSTVPFIFLSSHTEAEDRLKGLDLGAEDYLNKPVNARELVKKARNILCRRHMVQQVYEDQLHFALDQIPVAMALIDIGRTLHFTNSRFDRLVGHGVGVCRNRLHGRNATVTAAIEAALFEASQGSKPEPVTLFRKDTWPLHLIVFSREAAQGQYLMPISLFDPKFAPNTSLANLWRIYELTRQEQRIAGRLLQGQTLTEIQDVLNITRPTINCHLRGLFEKTGTRRQADLIRRLLLGAVQLPRT